MPDTCPLAEGPYQQPLRYTQIPEFCKEHCEALWDEAITNRVTAGEYQYEPLVPDPEDEEQGNACYHPSIGVVTEALHVINKTMRQYVIVDGCENCAGIYCEQGYKFTCPNT